MVNIGKAIRGGGMNYVPEENKTVIGLTDPSRLSPFDADRKVIHVIIETPKGSRNKYAFDQELKIFQLRKVLPEG
jgi:inorganic pyrophosphatase